MKLFLTTYKLSDGLWAFDHDHQNTVEELLCNGTEKVIDEYFKMDMNRPAKVLKTQGQRGTDNYGREHYSVIMSPDYASKKISKGTPVIPAPRLGKEFKKYQDRMPKAFQKRTKTQPKK